MRSTLKSRSIKSLYKLALAEGEGVGTAYEYFAKRLILRPWLAGAPQFKRVLLPGLPEKYGSSLDFFLLAQELGAVQLVAIDDRPAVVKKARANLSAAQRIGELTGLTAEFVLVSDLGKLNGMSGFDLCLSSEVLQRLSPEKRQSYIQGLKSLAQAFALFTPNGDNPSHTNISGLSGLRLDELQSLMRATETPAKLGYIDMPPFPPGITRSAEQRTEAAGGRLEAIAMWGLSYHARLEPYFPSGWRQHRSHIVYALASVAP
ncbi:MAG TPA: class I SAM-dependent methyltransferase [Candidatus Acidoferrum sp.]|nr:class I SAM-dependent methyltransferase [Candidatus Acidoferrum sp.]